MLCQNIAEDIKEKIALACVWALHVSDQRRAAETLLLLTDVPSSSARLLMLRYPDHTARAGQTLCCFLF